MISDFQMEQDRIMIRHEFPTIDIDKEFVFYYDETNNIGKLSIKNDFFNVSDIFKNFVLGGVLLLKNETIDIESFVSSLSLAEKKQELKARNFMTGIFPECLHSESLNKYLVFLYDNNVFVHYSSFNLLYWSVVDIIDSMDYNKMPILNFDFINQLKACLYELAKRNIKTFCDVFIEFSYPDIPKHRIPEFLDAIVHIIDTNIDNMDFQQQMMARTLKELLMINKNSDMPFITNDDAGKLVDDFLVEYIRPFTIYKKSKHIFDEEKFIQSLIKNYRFLDGEEEINNFEFVNSKSDRMVQMSDVFVGLIGRLKEYLNKNDFHTIESNIRSLDGIAKKNLKLLIRLLKKSEQESVLFLHNVESVSELMKMQILMNFS